MKLISMTDFVLKETNNPTTLAESFQKCVTYANFLKQSLKLEFFVPCDENGNFLQEPEEFKEWIKSDHYFNASESVTHQCRMYKKAKDNVLFENYSVVKQSTYSVVIDSHGRYVWLSWNKSKTIENLINEVTEVSLTPNAIKQLGL